MRRVCVGILSVIFGSAVSLSMIGPVLAAADPQVTAPASASPVIISEIKLGGDSYSQGPNGPKDAQNFVSLFNQTDHEVSLTGWTLEYAKPSFDKTFCSDTTWTKHSISGSASATPLSGSLQPGQVSAPIKRSLNDNAAGSLHLVDGSNPSQTLIQDLVGWGNDAPCADTAAAATPVNGKSLMRYLDCQTNLPLDNNDNSRDFVANQVPSPGALNYPLNPACAVQDVSSTTDPSPPILSSTCEGVVLTELLPNPSGSDTGHEFIELFNPTAGPILLKGCGLQTTANNHVFSFSDSDKLEAGQYRAFYDSQTGLTLENSAGGTVWLLSPTEELAAINYPADLSDDVAWAFFGGDWAVTYQPTPDAANILLADKPCLAGQIRDSDTGYCRSTVTAAAATTLTPCAANQERNADTNRCRAVLSASVASSLIACSPNQTRNPATNRCRQTAAASTTPQPCAAGQVRNPATNRCRKVTALVSSNSQPCPAGQTRNPSTNRCRKAAGNATGGLASIKDSLTNAAVSGWRWVAAGVAVLAALVYAVYEWRQEIIGLAARVKNRLPGASPKS